MCTDQSTELQNQSRAAHKATSSHILSICHSVFPSWFITIVDYNDRRRNLPLVLLLTVTGFFSSCRKQHQVHFWTMASCINSKTQVNNSNSLHFMINTFSFQLFPPCNPHNKRESNHFSVCQGKIIKFLKDPLIS